MLKTSDPTRNRTDSNTLPGKFSPGGHHTRRFTRSHAQGPGPGPTPRSDLAKEPSIVTFRGQTQPSPFPSAASPDTLPGSAITAICVSMLVVMLVWLGFTIEHWTLDMLRHLDARQFLQGFRESTAL